MYKDSRGSIISIVGTIGKYICIVFQYTVSVLRILYFDRAE